MYLFDIKGCSLVEAADKLPNCEGTCSTRTGSEFGSSIVKKIQCPNFLDVQSKSHVGCSLQIVGGDLLEHVPRFKPATAATSS